MWVKRLDFELVELLLHRLGDKLEEMMDYMKASKWVVQREEELDCKLEQELEGKLE